jgi:hypothetical protein
MGLRGLTRMILAGALASLLSACWLSEKPLIADDKASQVDFAARYRGEGDDGPMDMTIVAEGGSAYSLVNEKGERLPVRFLSLKGDWYLMQAQGNEDEKSADNFYLYQALKVADDSLTFYSSDCEETPGKFKGMKRDTKTIQSCGFTRLDGLRAAALAYIARVEKGEITGDPKALHRIP